MPSDQQTLPVGRLSGRAVFLRRFFFMMVVQESKKSPLNALALQRRIADPNV